MKHVARWFSNAWPVVATAIMASSRELIFAAGMLLLAYGLSLVFWPAAFVVPGSILVWLAIPPTVNRSK
jgi:hypothetical protein